MVRIKELFLEHSFICILTDNTKLAGVTWDLLLDTGQRQGSIQITRNYKLHGRLKWGEYKCKIFDKFFLEIRKEWGGINVPSCARLVNK